jgi:hypothetical protein
VLKRERIKWRRSVGFLYVEGKEGFVCLMMGLCGVVSWVWRWVGFERTQLFSDSFKVMALPREVVHSGVRA